MQNGDLSNALTKRVLVSIDTIRNETKEIVKVFKLIPVVKTNYTYDRSTLSRFYLFADRSSFTLELIAFDLSEYDLSQVVEQLDEIGTNPFRYYSSYKSVDQLVSELPYRPEVSGVIDVPARQLMYGHWGLDFARV
jgi:hypothetical protein